MKPLTSLLLIFLCPISLCGDCGQFFSYGHQTYTAPIYSNYVAPVYQQKVVAVQYLHPVYYQVGYSVQREAIQQQQIRSDPEYVKWLKFKAFEAGYDAAQEKQAHSSPGNPGIANPQNSALALHCAECHGSNIATPKGEVYIDPSVAMSGDLITKSLKRLALPDNDPNKMPPNKTLDDKTKGQLMQELLSLFQPVPPQGQPQGESQ